MVGIDYLHQLEHHLNVKTDVELDAVDSNNKTPLRLAMGRDHKEIVYYLQSKLNRLFVSCRLRDIVFGPPGRSKAAFLFYFGNLFFWGYPVYFFSVSTSCMHSRKLPEMARHSG
ncbi:hypothetical protein OS493_017457 [Desmophyllum pertusum]|uniref:ANK_REP_REGION domain-containing protein n=1 Tax=Desmophyllum pertusum TaxID=174260 RepID=A0A9X0D2R9_9CNID|nr:hypothetical protein OS493_017457 [Desmophyllum pertusum]